MPIANARMYSATPAVKQAWKELLAWALRRARLDWPVIDHDAPAPLAALWARADLGLVMMCGLPYSQRRPRPRLIAAPVPSPARYGARPVYFTDLAVRADSPHRTLEDTFGGVLGYTLEDSMSGYVALRRHLAQFGKDGAGLYRKSVGGLLNARQVIDALAEGRIDLGPLDSYYHDLLRTNDPPFAARIRVVATTAAAPIPPLVSTSPLDEAEVQRLRDALGESATAKELSTQRDVLLLSCFAKPAESDYEVFEAFAAEMASMRPRML